MSKRIIIIISLIFICQFFSMSISPSSVYAMTRLKQWVNKVKPNTFPEVMPQRKKKTAQITKSKNKFSEQDLEIVKRLQEKEENLNKREAALNKKQTELQLLSRQVETKLDVLQSAIVKTEALRNERKKIEEKDISKIVTYYNAMQAENIAPFFNQMDRLTATQILMRMQAKKAAQVMQLLDPKVAVSITENVTRFKQNKLDSITNQN